MKLTVAFRNFANAPKDETRKKNHWFPDDEKGNLRSQESRSFP
jgi:hypothetical protein